MTTTPLEPPAIPRAARALLDAPYAQYLDVATLFEIQSREPESGKLRQPEELLFRTVHLSSELWLRLAGAELERAMEEAGSGNLTRAVRLVRRADEAVQRVIDATRMFEAMPAAEYHQFRVTLGNASGLQSPGYAYVRLVCNRLAESLGRLVGDEDELFRIYQQEIDTPRYAFCEALLDLDATLDRFRSSHVHIAQRFLGDMTEGTGGQGVAYLRNHIGQQHFSQLWALRGRLADATGAVSYGYGGHRSERRQTRDE
ncbi:MAG TPA: tryptophan 2,3-dioxygenase family protein [Thermomicrobiales bacterium]|nr:tryptophan 2,3-dioxygenase family protein [Thermomicrobiales bacterium]